MRQPSALLASVAALVWVSGCVGGRATLAERLQADSPRVQVEAIAEVVRTSDRRHIGDLIDLLESDDEGVRFTASAALRRLTGQDFGMLFARTDEERAIGVARWRQWWRAQGPTAAGGPAPAGGPAAPNRPR